MRFRILPIAFSPYFICIQNKYQHHDCSKTYCQWISLNKLILLYLFLYFWDPQFNQQKVGEYQRWGLVCNCILRQKNHLNEEPSYYKCDIKIYLFHWLNFAQGNQCVGQITVFIIFSIAIPIFFYFLNHFQQQIYRQMLSNLLAEQYYQLKILKLQIHFLQIKESFMETDHVIKQCIEILRNDMTEIQYHIRIIQQLERNFNLKIKTQVLKSKGINYVQIRTFQIRKQVFMTNNIRLLKKIDKQNASPQKKHLNERKQNSKEKAKEQILANKQSQDQVNDIKIEKTLEFKTEETKEVKKKQIQQQNQISSKKTKQRDDQQIKVPIQPIFQDKYNSDYVHKSVALFSGDVLDDQQDYKLFLMTLIQSNFQARIKRTPLLFSYHPKRQQNLHPFIDGVSPFIFLAKTTSGYHIAAISQAPLNQRKHSQKRGWIISLTNRKAYPSLPGKSAISYDQVYLIFGNQQLRIDGSSLSISSNFGMHAGYYQSGGDKLSNLFGVHTKEIELQAFEIFKIQFM